MKMDYCTTLKQYVEGPSDVLSLITYYQFTCYHYFIVIDQHWFSFIVIAIDYQFSSYM